MNLKSFYNQPISKDSRLFAEQLGVIFNKHRIEPPETFGFTPLEALSLAGELSFSNPSASLNLIATCDSVHFSDNETKIYEGLRHPIYCLVIEECVEFYFKGESMTKKETDRTEVNEQVEREFIVPEFLTEYVKKEYNSDAIINAGKYPDMTVPVGLWNTGLDKGTTHIVLYNSACNKLSVFNEDTVFENDNTDAVCILYDLILTDSSDADWAAICVLSQNSSARILIYNLEVVAKQFGIIDKYNTRSCEKFLMPFGYHLSVDECLNIVLLDSHPEDRNATIAARFCNICGKIISDDYSFSHDFEYCCCK